MLGFFLSEHILVIVLNGTLYWFIALLAIIVKRKLGQFRVRGKKLETLWYEERRSEKQKPSV